jgi:pimeloyl-ACP methyl ester carboxylesterase
VGPSLKDSAYAMERSRAGLARKEIALPDGSRIVYLEGGSGAPLVLVHGFGADKDNFTRVARYLTPHYRVIVPDLVGFGESSHRTDVDYHYAAQAQRVHAFVQALGLTRIDLGGNSMGGGIAMSYRRAASAGGRQPVADRLRRHRRGAAQRAREDHRDTGTNPLMITKESDFPAFLRFVMSDPPYIPGSVMDTLARERIANQALERQVFLQIATDSVERRGQGPADADADRLGRRGSRAVGRHGAGAEDAAAERAGRRHAARRPRADDRAAAAVGRGLPALPRAARPATAAADQRWRVASSAAASFHASRSARARSRAAARRCPAASRRRGGRGPSRSRPGRRLRA